MSLRKSVFHDLYSILYYNRLILALGFGVVLLYLAPVFSFSPAFSFSPTVVINEIAWMGTKASSSDEWIEFYNTTDSQVDLTNWAIYEGTTLVISLSGTIAAHSYYLLERSDDNSVSDIPADKFGSWAGGGLSNDGEYLVLRDGNGNAVDEVDASSGWSAGIGSPDYKTMERDDNGWHTNDGVTMNGLDVSGNPMNGTPRSGNSQKQNDPAPLPNPDPEEPVAPVRTISFSSPASVVAGSEFTVTVNLENFNSGSYYVKVLVGKGDKFYDGRTKGTNGVWLAWNAGWTDFPKISVGLSGSASQTVKAKTDGDISGGYEIKVRTYDDKNTLDSQVKNISVKAEPEVVSATSEASGGSAAVDDEAGSDPVALELVDGGEVLGEVDREVKKKFTLNFYLVTGIFGLVVGSGGVILAFRKEPKELQKAGSRKLGSAHPEPQIFQRARGR